MTAINRYYGNTGKSEYVSEKSREKCKYNEKIPPVRKKTGGVKHNSGGFKLPFGTECGDILVLGIMLLLYLESHDTDFLIVLIVLALSFYGDKLLPDAIKGLI